MLSLFMSWAGQHSWAHLYSDSLWSVRGRIDSPPGWTSWQHAVQPPLKSWWPECTLATEVETFKATWLTMSESVSHFWHWFPSQAGQQLHAVHLYWIVMDQFYFLYTTCLRNRCVYRTCTYTACSRSSNAPCFRSHLTAQPSMSCSSRPSSRGSESSATSARSGNGKSEISWLKIYWWENTGFKTASFVTTTMRLCC